MEAEDRLEDRPVEPGGRAGVPGPTAAAHVRGSAVYVAGDDVGLDLVTLDSFGVGGVADRVEDLQQLETAAALAEPGDGLDDPGGRMGVLASVLADAGKVALDVAGVERLVVEGRREQEDEPPGAIDELLL